MIRELNVRRNGMIGGATGVVFAAVVYAFFVVVPGSRFGGPILHLTLAFTIAATTAILVAVSLTARAIARRTMSPPKWIRRGGTAALVSGLALAGFGVAAPAVSTTPAGSIPQLAYRWVWLAALVGVYGVWALHTALKPRERYHWVGAAGAITAGLGFVMVTWVAAVDFDAVLGVGFDSPVGVSQPTFVGVLVLLLSGSTIIGAAAARVPQVPRAPSIALALSFPVGVAALAGVFWTDSVAFTFTAVGVPVGLAWAGVGWSLRNGYGVPPADVYGTDLGVDFDETELDAGAPPEDLGADPAESDSSADTDAS